MITRFWLHTVAILIVSFSTITGKAQFENQKMRFKFVKKFKFYNPDSGAKINYQRLAKVGYGIPYGGYGVNLEFGTSYVSITGGLGYGKFKGADDYLGFAIGLRGYLLNREKKLRPRISGYYALNNVYVEDRINNPTYGPAVGVGFRHQLAERLFYDIEYVFIINSMGSYRPAERSLESVASPSLGIGISF